MSFEIRKYSIDFFEIWNDFISKSKNGTFLFHRNFMEYNSDRFIDFSLLVFKDEKLDLDKISETINFPLFVKPSEGGSSIGMSKVSCKEDLLPAIEKAFEVHHKVLIEEFIEGREFSCGVMQVGEKEIIAFPATEIVSQTEFFYFFAK